jgi:hypothetical protein
VDSAYLFGNAQSGNCVFLVLVLLNGRHVEFCNRLRRDGIDARLDQFEQSPPQGWPLWCARQILDSNYVLLVCTKSYRDRFLSLASLEKFGPGRGVK